MNLIERPPTLAELALAGPAGRRDAPPRRPRRLGAGADVGRAGDRRQPSRPPSRCRSPTAAPLPFDDGAAGAVVLVDPPAERADELLREAHRVAHARRARRRAAGVARIAHRGRARTGRLDRIRGARARRRRARARGRGVDRSRDAGQARPRARSTTASAGSRCSLPARSASAPAGSGSGRRVTRRPPLPAKPSAGTPRACSRGGPSPSRRRPPHRDAGPRGSAAVPAASWRLASEVVRIRAARLTGGSRAP